MDETEKATEHREGEDRTLSEKMYSIWPSSSLSVVVRALAAVLDLS